MALMLVVLPSAAKADPKPWYFSWGFRHWEETDFSKRYIADGKTPYNTQWDARDWEPQDWIDQRGNAMNLINGFYRAGILTDQYVDDEVPVLEVGRGFFDLGGEDQRRVLETVDVAYNITAACRFGAFDIVSEESGDVVGHYTKYGAQFQ